MVDENQVQTQAPGIPVSAYKSPINTLGSTILLLTNPDIELSKMEAVLRGLSVDKNGNAHAVGEPLMNDYGVNSVLGQVQSLCNRVCFMSNFDEKIINPVILQFILVMIKDLMVNWHIYEIDYNTRNVVRAKILQIAQNYAYQSILRAKNEGDKRFLSKTTQEVRYSTSQEKPPGRLEKAMGWRK